MFLNHLYIVSDSWTDSWVLIMQQLKSSNIKIHTDSMNHLTVLKQFIKWVEIFEALTQINMNFYEVIINSVRIKTMNVEDEKKKSRIKKTLFIVNFSCLKIWIESAAIVYIDWLSQSFVKNKKLIFAVIELIISEQANNAI